MAKIITITCNTAIDYRLEIDQLRVGETLLARRSHQFAGGKGINVAKTIASLDLPVLALGFVGKQSLPSFAALANDRLSIDFTVVDGATRTNITLHDSHSETHIRSQGFSVNASDCQRLLETLDHCLAAEDIVVIAGSLPAGAPDDFMQTIIRHCQHSHALPILDSNGAGLQYGILAQPFMFKPNTNELSELSAKPLDSSQNIIDAGLALINSGCQNVIVSRDQHGLIAINKQEILVASIDPITEPIISTIGCGDALVAGLAIASLQKNNFAEMLGMGIACASANLASTEPGVVEPDLVGFYKTQVQIKCLTYSS